MFGTEQGSSTEKGRWGTTEYTEKEEVVEDWVISFWGNACNFATLFVSVCSEYSVVSISEFRFNRANENRLSDSSSRQIQLLQLVIDDPLALLDL